MFQDENDNSIVLRIDFGARSLLFTGDAEAHAETRMLAPRTGGNHVARRAGRTRRLRIDQCGHVGHHAVSA